MAVLGFFCLFVFTAFRGDCSELILFCNQFLFASLSTIKRPGLQTKQKKHMTKKYLSARAHVCASVRLSGYFPQQKHRHAIFELIQHLVK